MPRRVVSGRSRRGISARRSAFKSTTLRAKKRSARSPRARRPSAGLMRLKKGRSLSVRGRGDYTISAPASSMGGGGLIRGTAVPEFIGSKHGCIIKHREYVGDINSIGTDFAVQKWTINAENPSTFPWLSSVAGNFQQYEFLGLMFEFKSNAADALTSSNVSLGSVMMAVRYDAENISLPDSKSEFLNLQGSTSGRPACSQAMGVECYRPENPLGVYFCSQDSSATAGAGRDSRFEDIGDLFVATQGIPGNSIVGELWVSYSVRLLKPRLGGGIVGSDIAFSRYCGTGLQLCNGAGDGLDIFGLTAGNLMVAQSGCTFPMQFQRGTYNTSGNQMSLIQFPVQTDGIFLLTLTWNGNTSSSSSINYGSVGGTGLMGYDWYPSDNGSALNKLAGEFGAAATTAHVTVWQLLVRINGPSVQGTKYGPCLQLQEPAIDPVTASTFTVSAVQVPETAIVGLTAAPYQQLISSP